MSEKREINKDYEKLGRELIENDSALAYIKNSRVKIAYLASNAARKRGKTHIVNGVCELVAPRNKWAIDYDFIITLYEPNIIGFTMEQKKILLLHELLHVGIEVNADLFNEDNNAETYFVKPHDHEEFDIVAKRYGNDWASVNAEVKP